MRPRRGAWRGLSAGGEVHCSKGHWALGRAYILQEKFGEAEIVLRKAVEIQPNRTDARYQFAIALRRLGKTDEAKREFELVEKLNKEFREGRNQ